MANNPQRISIRIRDAYSRTFQGYRLLIRLAPNNVDTVNRYLKAFDGGSRDMPLDIDDIDYDGKEEDTRGDSDILLLTCGHNFCAHCIIRHLKTHQEKPPHSARGVGSPAGCPLCTSRIRSPPSYNLFVRDVIRKWAEDIGFRPKTSPAVKVDGRRASKIVKLFFALK
ncbi:uncharacterized protein EV420DRAFT_1488934 [Desarmillaria tabescens]|uniref:Zinc finger C3HC4 RING-type domain-containing protein n=1 Tax=Armillaria tabescens TaxID=1929756 RepID=A0AA39J0E8_ARMTA|nr:uncharacterized protein EV420DRAFT_1488934 [Desarmillaria tabescens]KAK0433840.1 hypothetical protein EV420DRAFT_1488934 [Desarmillaria tabescens]